MTEEQIKALCKFLIDNGNHSITDTEKEMLKQAVDQSRNWQELFTVAIVAKYLDK